MNHKRIVLAAIGLGLLLCLTIVVLVISNSCSRQLPDNIEEKAAELKAYCKKRGYSTELGILVDYSRHSGRPRFYVWDFEQGKVVIESLCAQGCGKDETAGKNMFSNEVGSLCSSLGHYKIGRERAMKKPRGRMAFTLVGLDKTNSNAVVRGILLHAVTLPTFAIYPLGIPSRRISVLGRTVVYPYSEGCVTIPFDHYNEVAEKIHRSSKPIILWVYN